MFKLEKDVRQWMRDNFEERLFWVEPEYGGDTGFTDCLFAYESGLIPIELKRAMKLKKGGYSVKYRPKQVRVANKLEECRIINFTLAGVVDEEYLIIDRTIKVIERGAIFLDSVIKIYEPHGFVSYIYRSA